MEIIKVLKKDYNAYSKEDKNWYSLGIIIGLHTILLILILILLFK